MSVVLVYARTRNKALAERVTIVRMVMIRRPRAAIMSKLLIRNQSFCKGLQQCGVHQGTSACRTCCCQAGQLQWVTFSTCQPPLCLQISTCQHSLHGSSSAHKVTLPPNTTRHPVVRQNHNNKNACMPWPINTLTTSFSRISSSFIATPTSTWVHADALVYMMVHFLHHAHARGHHQWSVTSPKLQLYKQVRSQNNKSTSLATNHLQLRHQQLHWTLLVPQINCCNFSKS